MQLYQCVHCGYQPTEREYNLYMTCPGCSNGVHWQEQDAWVTLNGLSKELKELNELFDSYMEKPYREPVARPSLEVIKERQRASDNRG